VIPKAYRNGNTSIFIGIHAGNCPSQTPRWLTPGAQNALMHGE
jgi:hypothetical protein